MTLNTKVYLSGPIAPRQAFETAISAVLKAADREGESAIIDPDTSSYEVGVQTLNTLVGQGLPAWTWCHYRPDGPLALVDEYDDDDNTWMMRPACDLEISWDTAYGYNDNGLSCTQLHVLAIIELRRTLPQGVTMSWKNEYSGEFHTELNGFDEFLGNGSSAMNWFESVVKPALKGELND